MITFIKAQAAAFTASIIDFLITILCVQTFGLWYVLGSILGTLTGGIVNFSMGRIWVFNSRENDIRSQISRYIFVWCGYLLLITLGIYLFTNYLTINYILSKAIMTGVFGIPYNYLLQKKFIFLKKLKD
jgi:putative flippase GtrA